MGVATDPSKIQAMLHWPIPKSVKDLRGFLGLTGYYRKFVRHYGIIAKPLTDLLKKNNFNWTHEATEAFASLKEAMSTAPVLKLPNFQEPFVVESDASQGGIGAVLMQSHRPIAFMSKKLGIKNQSLSTYERELLALYTAISKWRHYLLGAEFVIKTDQISLKYLLEQRINTPMQHRGLSKLLGLSYRIEYKKRVENKVADALSRVDTIPGNDSQDANIMLTVSEAYPQWMQQVHASYVDDPWIIGLQDKLTNNSSVPHITLEPSGVIRYKNIICVGSTGDLRHKLLKELHDSIQGGHSGITATYHRIKRHFYWPLLKDAVHNFIQQCSNCQLNKSEHVASPGLLQPLPIPPNAWCSVSMDFITGLPKSKGFEVIFVVVDRFTKYAHFIGLSHPYTATYVATAYLDCVYKLHGLPNSIVSDRDPIFTGRFWKELFTKLGVQLNMSTAYHPQSDGQTEKVNQCLEQYLRSIVFDKCTKWAHYLPMAEWWYNTNWHSALQVSPFEALYGYIPHVLGLASAPRSSIDGVNELLRDRNTTLLQLKANLVKAQERMRRNEDKHRSERSFAVGDWVYLKLQPYRQVSIQGTRNHKLSSKFYGPFEVVKRIGTVAYELNLPPGSLIDPVFHVSQLKKKLGNHQIPSPSVPISGIVTRISLQPQLILGRRIVPRNNVAQVQWLVQWKNQTPEEATWKDYEEFTERFPEFSREDTNFAEERAMR